MDKPSDRYWVLLVYVVLALTTLAVYWQARNHDFIAFDDDLYVTENSNVQAGLTWHGIKWAFTTTQAYNWHPLTWMSHMLDCHLYRLNPAGHHFTSVLFHIANTLLLFLVLKQMTGSLLRSAFVAALFALHPLHIESVAWVSERKDVLSTFFWILTMLLYVRYVRRPGFATYLPVMLSLALGLLAKQMLVTLPLVLLLLDYWPLGRFTLRPQNHNAHKPVSATSSFSRCFVEKLPLLALSAVASLIVFLVQSRVYLVKKIPITYRLGNAVVAYAKYITKMFWPLDLGILYPHPGVGLPLWQILAAGLLLVCISIGVILLSRDRRWLTVGWLWYLGTLVPVIGLVQVGLQAMADRYTYVPLIGLFIIIAWGAPELLSKQRYAKLAISRRSTMATHIVLATLAVTVLSVLTALTCRQLPLWQNSIILYKHTVAVTANNDILHYNLGVLLFEKGKINDAIKHWSEAVRIKPDQPTIHKNLAKLLARQGNIDRAIEHNRQALKYKPEDQAVRKSLENLLAMRERLGTAEILYNRANLLAGRGKLDEAITCYTQALQLKPDHTGAHNNLGNALFLQGKLEDALTHYSKALAIDPNQVDARYNMAVILSRQGKTDQAIKQYRRILEIDPDYTKARHALDALLKEDHTVLGP